MPHEIKLGTLAGLQLSWMPSAIVGSIGLWIILSVIGLALIHLAIGEAIVGGLMAVGLHVAGEMFHQWGHARAARRAGYPMTGIRYWGVLGTSIYPADEPPLPASIHIRRALGGPIASITLAIGLGIIGLMLPSSLGLIYWLVVFAALENLFIYGLGALLPLGFTDGSTLLKYRR
jgi:hypothetical protein